MTNQEQDEAVHALHEAGLWHEAKILERLRPDPGRWARDVAAQAVERALVHVQEVTSLAMRNADCGSMADGLATLQRRLVHLATLLAR